MSKLNTTPDALSTDRLKRNVAAGMEVAFLQTNFYGPGNKKIKHQVHRGALQIPEAVLAGYAKPNKEYDLPGLDYLVRPSLDESRKQVVAQVRFEERMEDVVVDGLPQKRQVSRILITNEFLHKPADAKRIRGGGGDEICSGPPGSSAATAMEIDDVVPANQNTIATAAPTITQTTSTNITDATVAAPVATLNVCLNDTVTESSYTQSSTIPVVAKSTAPVSRTETTPNNDVVGQLASQPLLSASELEPQETPSSDAKPNGQPKSQEAKVKDPKVVPLETRPSSQWEKRKPTKEELPHDALKTPPRPEWYKEGEASEIEKALLPEWFDDSAKHRTPESYVQVREKMILMSSQLGENRYLTGTLVRRAIPGDAASLLRLHDFLTSHGIINENAINDTQPSLKLLYTNSIQTTRDNIVKAVVQQLRNNKLSNDSKNGSQDSVEVNWDDVAAIAGDGSTAATCERTFMEMTTASAPGGDCLLEMDSSFTELLGKTKPEVLRRAMMAALETSDNFDQTRTAACVASVLEIARSEAQSHELRLAQILSQTLDTRMKRLEDRLVMVEEVEGMLDAERMALNLERRDLYTARCRHWFNGT